MISEKRIHGGQVNPRALDALPAQEESSLKPTGFGKNALKENSPHTLSLSFPEQLVSGEHIGLDGASMGLTLFHFGVMSSKPKNCFVKKFCTT